MAESTSPLDALALPEELSLAKTTSMITARANLRRGAARDGFARQLSSTDNILVQNEPQRATLETGIPRKSLSTSAIHRRNEHLRPCGPREADISLPQRLEIGGCGHIRAVGSVLHEIAGEISFVECLSAIWFGEESSTRVPAAKNHRR